MNPLIALLVTATTFLAYAGDPKIPTDHRPLSILLNDTILQNFGDEVYRDNRDHPIFLRQYVKPTFLDPKTHFLDLGHAFDKLWDQRVG